MNIPEIIEDLLLKEKLCSLATSNEDHPHVCLMNFTFLPDDSEIILSSRLDSTKVQYIKNNPSVALLLYSFNTEHGTPISCTLHGTAKILSQDKEKDYRDIHFQKHSDMGGFIKGENISIIKVSINDIALSDVEDSVRTWTVNSSILGSI